MSETPGKIFFDEHMRYIHNGDIDGMIDAQYDDDAILISPFDMLDTPPPHIIKGKEAIKAFFHQYMQWQGTIEVEQLYHFAETEEAISFHAVFTSNTGRWVVADAWHLRNGKISAHYSFAHKMDEPR